MIQILHNTRCSKSRECVAFFDTQGQPYEIVDYIKTPLKFREIKSLLKKLGAKAMDVVRTNEPQWAAFKDSDLSNDDVIRILARHPILLQRPIAINGDKAVIARPLENIREIL